LASESIDAISELAEEKAKRMELQFRRSVRKQIEGSLQRGDQLLKVLPKRAKAAEARKLTKAIDSHLKKIFKKLGGTPKGKKCKAMEGLLAECKDLIAEDSDPAVMDAALIGAAQCVEH
jgi:hypothetical protein